MSTDEISLCGALHPQRVLDHYAYGDPLPVYARYVADEDDEYADDSSGGITIYVPCQREAGHAGKHLSIGNRGWSGEGAVPQ